ncbi:adenylyltransferase/cytidyltransferase family protein [Streptomyces turgidiscabies]|uniref:adenylyltransferase/cytidyltransferase family protein n=1 Tax=Streptomyces TaxID=1883 RepID=UPI002252B769|nr:adenylyltransferase/cytidyltransferase family protein [Streptomyces sp. NBC_00847]MCX4884837.1 adenylyltransferase/cytidyltransferase family protein [Streptomyces sp. NBC_00847]
MTAPSDDGTGPVPLDDIRDWLSSRPGDGTVLATGCFDLLHAGHLTFLEEASRLGDLLVVGVNSDQTVRHIKGPRGPSSANANAPSSWAL